MVSNTDFLSFSSENIMPAEDASDLAALHPYILPETLSDNGETCWGRLLCQWHEKKSDGNIQTHRYAALIDGRDGGIYFDCRPGKIFAKCVLQLFVRPLFTLIKTIYHISLYPIFSEMMKSCQNDSSLQERNEKIYRAALDIVRTPLYGFILTITTVAVLIIGTISPLRLYEGRKLLGQIEQAANWGEIHTPWTLADCFQPFPLEVLEIYARKKDRPDTSYENLTSVEKSLANFARACIRARRRRFDIFSCAKLNSNATYNSPILMIYDEIPASSPT